MLGGGVVSRRLAAVLPAVVGSSPLREADEAGTLARLKIALHEGRTDETTGAVEPTPIAAV
jgi:hypothetical protein